MAKQKEIIQALADERISTIPTVTTHESAFAHSNIHAPESDNQDLSAFASHVNTAHLQFNGLAKITVGTTEPTSPAIGDIWINSSET